jgi:6-phospho-beta-glucosidase
VLPKLIAEHAAAIAEHVELPASLIRRHGTVPSYYLRYYYLHDEVLAEQASGPTRADQVAAIERELLARYADPALDRKPALLEQRGGAYYSEAAVALIADLLGPGSSGGTRDASRTSSTGSSGGRHVVNVRNRGTLPFLPDDAVIEVPARVDSGRIEPEPVPAVDALERGLIAHVAAYEELALATARDGGTDAVATALLAHPLVGQAAPADRLAELLVDANRRFLPWTAPR